MARSRATTSSAIAKQLSDIRDSVVSLANTSYQGTYVFAGSQGGTRPFTLDSTTTPVTTTYNGDTVTQKIETPDGQSVQTNVAGSAIFTATGADLLGTLNQLVADVSSGSTNIAADSSALTSALSNVSTQRSTIGSSLSRLTVDERLRADAAGTAGGAAERLTFGLAGVGRERSEDGRGAASGAAER